MACCNWTPRWASQHEGREQAAEKSEKEQPRAEFRRPDAQGQQGIGRRRDLCPRRHSEHEKCEDERERGAHGRQDLRDLRQVDRCVRGVGVTRTGLEHDARGRTRRIVPTPHDPWPRRTLTRQSLGDSGFPIPERTRVYGVRIAQRHHRVVQVPHSAWRRR